MTNDFYRFIAENNLVKAGDKVLLAVSGGIDSMVMTHLFLQTDIKIGIAHCNFSLRGSDSDADNDLVRLFAAEHNIPFYTRLFDTKLFARKNGLSIQMAARELRYKWFEEIRIEYGYDSIAVAHNLNDNIETLLINLTRGTGIAGLTGMRPTVNNIIRPLLFATRAVIKAYCIQNSIVYREDKSNADTKYIRNKIRHLIIPVLREINPSIESTLNDTAERFVGINEIVSEYISELRERVSEEESEIVTFNISLLKEYLSNKTVIFELFKPFGISSVQLNDLLQVVDGKTGGQIFTDTHRIIKNRNELIVIHEVAEDERIYLLENIDDFLKVPGIASAGYIPVDGTFEIPSDPFNACVDAEKILFPLVIRKWKPGDHFYPLGMKQKKKLSDYFIDNKYSIIDKESKLILESDGNIVWIIGDRLDNRFRITRSTKTALLIKSVRKALVIKPVK